MNNMASSNRLPQAQTVPTCQHCGKTYNKNAHLNRHIATKHTANVPLVCQFCHKVFRGRTDVLRGHYRTCDARGDQPIPPPLERGRKRHACDECSRLKVKCDNLEPSCSKCVEFNRTCVRTTIRGDAMSPGQDSSPRGSMPADPSRSSINFLLNSPGDGDFQRAFPGASSMSPRNPPADVAMSGYNFVPMLPSTPEANDYHQANVLNVLLEPLEFNTTYLKQRETNSWVPGRRPFIGHGFYDSGPLDQVAYDIREKLRYTLQMQQQPAFNTGELLEVIETITGASIDHDLQNYFRNWHKHAPMVHEATFNPCTAALPLVLALMGLGGMYSSPEEQVIKLKLVDTIETLIFSQPSLSLEYDSPGRVIFNRSGSEEEQQYQLEELQGAYLYVVLQYWTGNPVARSRVRQQRFARVVAIFHQLNLQTIQHDPNLIINDPESFRKWIRTESAIRLATIATMLDNAFGIFNNMASRFQWAEIDLPFPSSNIYFKLASYDEMVSKQLYPSSKMKIRATFGYLFFPPDVAHMELKHLRESDLTSLDMQILIHFLYSQLWNTVFNSPVLSMPGYSMNLITTSFRRAMTNWKTLWDSLRAKERNTEGRRLHEGSDYERSRSEGRGFDGQGGSDAQQIPDTSAFHDQSDKYYDIINDIIHAFERYAGKFPPIPSDCAKGAHLKIVLDLP